MPKAVIIQKTGGAEVLELKNIAEPKKPAAGQVLLRQTAIGLNYMDIYYRSGLYKAPRLPMIPGMEACGIVEAVGEGVKIPVGTRVAYATASNGAYCEKRLINERYLVGVPNALSDEEVVAVLGKALTAHFLLFRTYQVKKGDTILVHAAAGGVGQILSQWAKHLGARVIGTVGSEEKVQKARNAGCSDVIVYTKQDFAKETKRLTDNHGVMVAYDSVGKDTFAKSLQALMPLGLMVSYGQSSGAVPPMNVLSLAQKGLFLTRPTLMQYKSSRAELLLSAIEVFKMVADGALKINIDHRYPLSEIQQAHNDMQSRRTTGSCVITLD